MNVTYLLLNLVFMAVTLGVLLAVYRKQRRAMPMRAIVLTTAILLLFTLVFDALIVATGIVDYNYTKTLGITFGPAPIEDLFYAVLAGILIPSLWKLGEGRHARKG